MSATVTHKLAPLIAYLDSLTDERADVQRLSEALAQLEGLTVDDLKDYAVFDEMEYRRNLICESPMYELLLLTWRSGQRSPIHDHAKSVCGVKILQGTMAEVRYKIAPCGMVVPTHCHDLGPGGICASVGSDIHEISNLQAPGEDLLTLHIYSPPLREMAMYDPARTGKAKYRPVNFEFHGGSGI